MSIADNLARIQERMLRATLRAERDPTSVTLVGVCKTVGREVVEQAYNLGLRDFGENRVADAEAKFEQPLPGPITLHLIGHLQSNKARRAASLFDIVHSVDSVGLAQSLDRHSAGLERRLPILLQVNVSGEASKEGFEPDAFEDALTAIAGLSHLAVRGLMTIAPYTERPAETRPVFRALKRLFDRYADRPDLPDWRDLSMGMTNDFEIAIEEGATLVRVGRALFQA